MDLVKVYEVILVLTVVGQLIIALHAGLVAYLLHSLGLYLITFWAVAELARRVYGLPLSFALIANPKIGTVLPLDATDILISSVIGVVLVWILAIGFILLARLLWHTELSAGGNVPRWLFPWIASSNHPDPREDRL